MKSTLFVVDIKLKYHPDKGRYLVVEKDVKPGKFCKLLLTVWKYRNNS